MHFLSRPGLKMREISDDLFLVVSIVERESFFVETHPVEIVNDPPPEPMIDRLSGPRVKFHRDRFRVLPVVAE